MTDQSNTAGVQDLIDRLSKEGVAEGQRQGEGIVDDARRKADDVLETAKRQADTILRQAREEAQQYQTAGEEALKLACRDAARDFGARIHDGFRHRLQDLVQHQLTNPELVKSMILEITREATSDVVESGVDILLPVSIVHEDETRRKIEAGEPDALTEFTQGLIGHELREGFTISLGEKSQSGMTVRVVNQNVEIDLTEDAITEMLARHLLPKFRAIMRKT